MAKLIAKTYGEALFTLALEEEKLELFTEEIGGLRRVLRENPDLSRLINHPKIPREDKTRVFEAVFAGRISREIVGLLVLIIAKGRYKETDGILNYFLDRVKECRGVGVAYVTTPFPLKEEQRTQVEKRILTTSGFNTMEMHYVEDSSLIGGMVIRIGDRVVDSSISTKLEGLEKQLLKIQLA